MGSGRVSKTRTALRAVIFVLIVVLGIGLISPAFVVNNEWDMRHVHGFFLEPEGSLDVVLIGASQLYTGYSARSRGGTMALQAIRWPCRTSPPGSTAPCSQRR